MTSVPTSDVTDVMTSLPVDGRVLEVSPIPEVPEPRVTDIRSQRNELTTYVI